MKEGQKNDVAFFIRALQSSYFPLTLASPLFSPFMKKTTNFRCFSPFVWFFPLATGRSQIRGCGEDVTQVKGG